MAACRCSRRSSEACRRAMTPPMPPAPLARRPVRGSIVVRSNGRTKAPLSRDVFAGLAPARRRPERAGHVAEAVKRAGTRLQRRLPPQNLIELLLVLLLVEQLAAGKAVDPGAQLGDAILVGESNLRLACDQPSEYVFAEGEIGRGADGPHRHDHQRADHDPECDRSDAHLAAGMNEAQARPPRMRPAGIIAMVVL